MNIISIVRLVTVVDVDLNSPDLDWNFAPLIVWTVTESNIAVVCGKEFRIPYPPHLFKPD